MKVRRIILIVLITMFIASCAEMFEFNLFSELDFVAIKTKDDFKTDEEYGDYLLDEMDSETVIEEIIEDGDEKVEEVIAALKSLYEDEDKEKAQEAAIAVTDLKLAQSGADDLIDNIVNGLDDIMSGPTEGEETGGTEDIIAKMLPDTMLKVDEASGEKVLNPESKAEFVKVVSGLTSAAEDFSALSDILSKSDTTSEEIDGGVAVAAVLSIAVDKVIEDIKTDPKIVSDEDAAEVLFDIMTGQDTTHTISADFSGVFEDEGFAKILEASGFGALFGSEE